MAKSRTPGPQARVLSTALVGLALISLGGCAKGCNSSRSQVSQIRQKSVLKVQLTSEPVSLDPAELEDGVGLKLITQLREGLVGYDGEGKLQLELAESYKVSSDGKRFEFTLKPGLQWSDEQPVRVEDFVFGIRRALGPTVTGRASEQLMAIRGARDTRSGKLPVSLDPADRSLGVFMENGKLVFELEEPAPYFIQALTLPAALPVRRDSLLESGGKWSEDKAPGTGPYRFAAYQPGKRLLIEANPHYWDKTKAPSIGLIDFLFVTDESTGLNLFESGQLDLLTRVPIPDVPRLRKSGKLHTDPFLATYYIAFNTRKAPFDDRDFRRAVAGVIQREAIVRSLDTGETPARAWIPPGLEGHVPYQDPSGVFADSVKKVKGLLAHHPLAPVSASFDSGARNDHVMQEIQHEIAQSLGLKISLSNLDWKSYIKSIQTDSTPIYRFAWLSAFADPVNPLRVFTSSNPNNYTRWKNAEYDQLVDEIGRMAPGPARDAKISRAQKILVDEEAPMVPIYHYVQNHLVASRVRGFRVNPFGIIPFKELSFAHEEGSHP